jgi:tight adherence protein B
MADLDPALIEIATMLLGTVAVAGVVYALVYPFLSGERRVEERLQGATENRAKAVARKGQGDQSASRRKAVADTLKELESRQRASQRPSLRLRLERAGLDISTKTYWGMSIITGIGLGIAIFLMMPSAPPIVPAVVAFIGAFGLPHWFVSKITKRRQAKFLDEFANAIDVIVRGVKSGLPLNECLAIIARESPSPVREEFIDIVEQQRVGIPLNECFERMMTRMPLPEVKFFGIVIGIQQQAGGNLSEALSNLSGVLRDRKRLQARVSALSAEAKTSAIVLGSLPPMVGTMVYITTPKYMSILGTTKVGLFLLACGGMWMLFGILVMRKMINFKY